MDLLNAARVGPDAGFREILDRIDSAQQELSDLRATVGRYGAVFDESGIVISGGGSLTVEGGGDLNVNTGGDLNVSGDATVGGTLTTTGTTVLGGDTTINGTTSISGDLNLANGIIGDNALESLLRGNVYRAERYNYAPPTTYGDLTGVDVIVPSWASQCLLMMSGSIRWIASPTAGSPYGYVRMWSTGGDYSPEQIVISGSLGESSGFVSWSRSVASPPSVIRVNLIGRAGASGLFVSGANANAALSVMAIFLR